MAFLIKYLDANIAIVTCYSVDSTCRITGITLTLDTILIPKSNRNVTSFEIYSSTLPRMTPSICEAFPNLYKIEARKVSLEVVNEDAFVLCKVIKTIDLAENNIVDF